MEFETNVVLLAIDDDAATLELVREALSQKGLEILVASDPVRGMELVESRRPQIVLLDLVMPGVHGMELLERILDFAPGTDVILITGHYSTESAVEAIRKGAGDYLTKPLSNTLLRDRVGKLVDDVRRRWIASQLDTELGKTAQFEDMVGRSPLIQEVFVWIRRVAPHYRTVLINGATGTGKELVARALHRLSPVASGRFVVCNASAVVETLFESELFGHVKGAFTGATQDKMGLFEYAHGGVLFLDEIGDMPMSTQAKLLRVLQHQEVQRVGSLSSRKVDVRVVAATNRHLPTLIEKEQFREDLYYRLSMFEMTLPRLADRKEDLPLLVRHFIDRFSKQYQKPICGISPQAQSLIARYSWPGNVRELENVLGAACGIVDGDFINVCDLPERLKGRAPQQAARSDASPEQEMLPISEVVRRHAMRVLDCVGGNKTKAAEILGINRATLYRLVEEGKPKAGTAAGS